MSKWPIMVSVRRICGMVQRLAPSVVPPSSWLLRYGRCYLNSIRREGSVISTFLDLVGATIWEGCRLVGVWRSDV